jgi:hypothetical protein
MKEFSVTPTDEDFELFECPEGPRDLGERWCTLGYMRAHDRVTLAILGKPEFRGREIEAVLFALDHPELPIIQLQEIFRNGTDAGVPSLSATGDEGDRPVCGSVVRRSPRRECSSHLRRER